MNFVLCLFAALMFVAPAFAQSPKQKLTANFAPEQGRNGYIGSMTFFYQFRMCPDGVNVAIVSNKAIQPTHYRYKGKDYTPADLGLNAFEKPSLTAVPRLFADVYDGSQLIGRMTMENVIDQGGMGCYGQVYEVKQDIPNFDDKYFKDRLQNFRLANPKVLAASSEPKYGSIVDKREREKQKAEREKRRADLAAQKKALEEEEEKLKAEEADAKAKAGGAAAVVAGGAAATETTATEPGKNANATTEGGNTAKSAGKNASKTANSKATSPTTSKPAPNRDAVGAYNQAQAEVAKKVNRADQQSQQVRNAGEIGVTAATGMWDDGMGLGLGLGSHSEDNSSYLSVIFANWDVPTSPDAPGKFWTGGYSYAAFDLGTSTTPRAGATLESGQDKFTTMQLGLNFFNNSFGWHIIRPIWGFTISSIDNYDDNGVARSVAELEWEFGYDLGVGLVGQGFFLSWTYNGATEVNMFQLAFQK